MQEMHWLDLTMYSLHLLMAKDLNGKGQHSLVMSGTRIAEFETQLTSLGFERDKRFTHKTYWTRPVAGMTHGAIQKVFSDAQLVLMPVDKIMPHRVSTPRPSQNTQISRPQSEQTDGPQLTTSRGLPGNAVGRPDDATARRNALLGKDSPRSDVRPASDVDSEAVEGKPSQVLSRRATGQAVRGGQGIGAGVESAQPAPEISDQPSVDDLAQPRQAVGEGAIDQRIEPKHGRSGDRDDDEGQFAVEVLLYRSTQWFRASTLSSPLADIVAALPEVLEGFAKQYNVSLNAEPIEIRVVDNETNKVVLHLPDNSQLGAAVAQFASMNEELRTESDQAEEEIIAGIDQSEPSVSSGAATESDPAIVAYRIRTEELFGSGLELTAYEHFSNDPDASDGVSFEVFQTALRESTRNYSGPVLLTAERSAIITSVLGINSRQAERLSAETDLFEILDAPADQHALAVSKALENRDRRISLALEALGWSVDSADDPSSVRWVSEEAVLNSAVSSRVWNYSATLQNETDPFVVISDDFSMPAEEFAQHLTGKIRAILQTEAENQITSTDAQSSKANDSALPVEAPSKSSPAIAPDEVEAAALVMHEEEESLGTYQVDREWRGLNRSELSKSEIKPSSLLKNDNVQKAFRLLKQAEQHGLSVLYANDRIDLLRFRGWGGVAQDFRTDNRTKSKNFAGERLAESLSMEPGVFNRTMLANRLESYYTPAQLVRSIWNITVRVGVSAGGRYLEPGCGGAYMYVGAPEEVQRHGVMVGIESDPIAVRIAKVVAPDVTIINKPYEQVVLDNRFDAVIGNVPFGETVITDFRYPTAKLIHDYFIVRSLDHLKPGGVMAIITSSGTMDKQNSSVRRQIMDRANLVAGFRLPEEAFEGQSASVTTDVLIFQRRPPGTLPDYDFTETTTVNMRAGEELQEFTYNRYFAENPDHILGNLTAISAAFGYRMGVRFGGPSDDTVIDRIAGRLDELVNEAIAGPIVDRKDWPIAQSQRLSKDTIGQAAAANLLMLNEYQGLIGDYTIVDDKIMEITDVINTFDDEGVLTGTQHQASVIAFSSKQQAVLRAYIPLRDAARRLVSAQQRDDDEELAAAQLNARQLYDGFVEAHGPVNARANLRIYGDDTGTAEVCALEFWDEENERVTGTSDTFEKRVIRPATELSANSSEEAFYLSIDQRGKVDLDWMAEVSNIDRDTLVKELLGYRIYVDPATNEYQNADIYLSGNVVQKLEDAIQAEALDARFELNRKALESVQPEPIPFDQITMRVGANWIPAEEILAFVSEILGKNLDNERDFKVRYSAGAGIWTVDVSDAFKRDFVAQRTALLGTKNASFESLLEQLLNNKRPSHYDKLEGGKSVLNEEATMASRAKQDEINERFYSWVGNDAERIQRFCVLYNRATNVIRVPTPDGSRLTFPGLSPAWEPYAHQCNMVAMALMGYNDMAAHPVGAGKTWEMVAIAIKLGQVGMHQKPLIAVPNHMLGQITREAKQMYPGARILMITGEDLVGNRRDRFLAVARNNKWDLVVCTHGMLNQISAPLDIVVGEFDKELSVIQAKIDESDNKRVERQLQALAKSVESKRSDAIKRHEDDSTRRGVLTIAQLGVDALLVDEAHLYKNLALNSSMNVLGVTTGGSQRAFNLNALGEYLRQYHQKSFGLHFFTGTPIANSMCELYVHNRILRPELLEQMGICHFDEWANRFGDVVSSLEALPEGGGFRVNERFARFVNLPEMIKLFRSFADVKSKEQLNLPTPTMHTEVVPVEKSEFQEAFMKHLAIRAIAVRAGRVKPNEDNMLSIATGGRKAALDMRLVNPILPEDSSIKLKTVAKNLVSEWEISAEVKGTQLVFMDLGTPGKDKPFTCYNTLRNLLIEHGMPGHEIAFIHDAKTHEAKEAIFSKVRSGEVRVLMGSTEKMGVGTNVQERLCAMHNVDCPWRPADIAQRRGRGERVGNLFFSTVKDYRYTTMDSFDLFMWETNKRKANFISQALADPATASREVAEEMDLGFAEVMAVTTGNPKIREKVETDDKVNKMERKQRAWYGDRANKMSMNHYLTRSLVMLEAKKELEQDIAKALPQSRFRNVTVDGPITDLQDGSTTWLYATEVGQAALSRLPVIEAKLMRNNETKAPLFMRIGGIELEVVLGLDKRGSIRGVLGGEALPVNMVHPSKNAPVLGKMLREWFDVNRRVNAINDELAVTQKGLASLNGFDPKAEWEHEADLKLLKAQKLELDTWFTSQNFDQVHSGPDPYLSMVAAYEATLPVCDDGGPIADQLEASEVEEDLFSTDIFAPYNDTTEQKHIASPSMR
ncbi:N-6 DNA methylase [Pseudomonas cannabina]|uniref:N-6 DNA methylase n=1 Tax=Pseudomonas cannabina TaxID=86840 RepID=UPI000EFFBCE7|nr:N-6 DNA methylase [Pseudomonas cannabina]